MVSTITETFFYEHFEQIGHNSIQPCHWLQLRAANGLAIPYVGYTESDVELCGKLMPSCGILVVKDPPSGLNSKVPGVLGMNILSKCYQEFFEQYGQSLFEVPSLTQAPTSLLQAFQRCHQVETQPSTNLGRVKARGGRACRVPGGSMMLVPSTCSAQYASGIVLFEPSESGLPPGLLVSPSLVKASTVPPSSGGESEDEDLLALVPEPPQALSMPAVDVVPTTSVEGVPSTSTDPGIAEDHRTAPPCSPQSSATDRQPEQERVNIQTLTDSHMPLVSFITSCRSSGRRHQMRGEIVTGRAFTELAPNRFIVVSRPSFNLLHCLPSGYSHGGVLHFLDRNTGLVTVK
ncbi:hypothetical protein N1851_030008 [Merluccius polli]|uniref:Uncharacterized protein n=1 Tax=Merluccius polli TaxID=89951 RepID=A0AA47NS74_MERPO|nr:hypothetical protein N1851_030008 [Merluccius polli]